MPIGSLCGPKRPLATQILATLSVVVGAVGFDGYLTHSYFLVAEWKMQQDQRGESYKEMSERFIERCVARSIARHVAMANSMCWNGYILFDQLFPPNYEFDNEHVEIKT